MSVQALGDFLASGTVRAWHSTAVNGTGPATLSSASAYVLANGSASPITAGVTLSVDIGGAFTGLHRVTVVIATAGLAAGAEAVVMLEGTLGGEAIRVPIAQFSVERTRAADIAAIAAQITADHGAGSFQRNTEPLTAAETRTALGLSSADLDTQLGQLPAIKAQTDQLDFAGGRPTVDVVAINGHALTGDGGGTPWGPA